MCYFLVELPALWERVKLRTVVSLKEAVVHRETISDMKHKPQPWSVASQQAIIQGYHREWDFRTNIC